MAYNLSLSNGDPLVTVADGSVDVNFTSLSLIGKNYAGYGQLMNENWIHLLENFSNSAPPVNPLVGQLWYDATNRTMKVYTSNDTWKVISSATASDTAPSSPVVGDQWWDTINEQLYIWSGSAWKLIGPLWSAANGITGAIPGTLPDIGGISHVVIKFYVNNVVVALWSKDAQYTVDPSAQIPGFIVSNTMVVKPGLNMAALTPSQIIYGTVENSLKLGGIAASNYVRKDLTTTQELEGPLQFNNAVAIRLGGGVDVLDDQQYSIGGPTTRLLDVYATTFHGVATSARYADLAERFEADAEYEPGTVVALGGDKEVTILNDDSSDEVFGVISTAPAHLMNAGAGTNATHPAIAVSGRVPVKVTGKVKKGDRLVSAGKGLARAASKKEITPWNVIGRALAHKTTDGVGTVEAIVKLSS